MKQPLPAAPLTVAVLDELERKIAEQRTRFDATARMMLGAATPEDHALLGLSAGVFVTPPTWPTFSPSLAEADMAALLSASRAAVALAEENAALRAVCSQARSLLGWECPRGREDDLDDLDAEMTRLGLRAAPDSGGKEAK